MVKRTNRRILLGIVILCIAFSWQISALAEGLDANQQIAVDFLNDPAVFEKFGEVNQAIWSYAELGLEEYNTSQLVTHILEKEGFTVEYDPTGEGVAGMPTCFIATYTNGPGPVIGVHGELDALPMLSQESMNPEESPSVTVDNANAPGHGCGHNTMATAATATVIAVKKAMDEGNFTGTIKMIGRPAEETVISGPFMAYGNVYDGIDVIIDNHGGTGFGTSYGKGANALFSLAFTFHGETAHSAGSPWSGVSALDAVELMNTNTEYLREHLFYTYRMHYVITEGGEAPNVVPNRATVWYFVRNTDERVEEMFMKVLDCAKAAALATGCTLEITPYTAIHQCYENKAIAETLAKYINVIGYPEWSEEELEFAKALQNTLGKEEIGLYDNSRLPVEARGPRETYTGGGSSDIGEVSLNVPLAGVNWPSSVPGQVGHHWSAVACNGTTIAQKGLMQGAKVMAATAIEYMTNPELLAATKAEFDKMKEDYPYCYDENGNFKSYLPLMFDNAGLYEYNPEEGVFFEPAGVPIKPPVGFLAAQMNKYRKAMAEKYLTPDWYDGPAMKTE